MELASDDLLVALDELEERLMPLAEFIERFIERPQAVAPTGYLAQCAASPSRNRRETDAKPTLNRCETDAKPTALGMVALHPLSSRPAALSGSRVLLQGWAARAEHRPSRARGQARSSWSSCTHVTCVTCVTYVACVACAACVTCVTCVTSMYVTSADTSS